MTQAAPFVLIERMLIQDINAMFNEIFVKSKGFCQIIIMLFRYIGIP